MACTVHPLAVYNLLYVGIPELYSVLKLNLEEYGVSSRLKTGGFLFRNLSIQSLSCCKDSLRNWSSSDSSCRTKPLEPPRRTLTNIKTCKSIKIPLCITRFLLKAYFTRQWACMNQRTWKLYQQEPSYWQVCPYCRGFEWGTGHSVGLGLTTSSS